MKQLKCWNCGAEQQCNAEIGTCGKCEKILPIGQYFDAYLLDAKAGILKRVSVSRDNTLENIQHYLKCKLIDIVNFGNGLHAYCDDESLLKDHIPCLISIADTNVRLAGNLLFMGNDENGSDTTPKVTIEELQSKLEIHRAGLKPVLETASHDNFISTQITKIRVCTYAERPEIQQ